MTSVVNRMAAAKLRPNAAWQVFRAVLDAMAHPGRMVELPPDLTGATPAVLLPMLALADLGASVAVLDDGAGWADAVSAVTSAPVAEIRSARFVAATRPITADELRSVCRGSAFAPENGALVCLSVADVDGGDWVLSGPGIAGQVCVSGVGDLLDARTEAVAGFPAGVDLLLITADGRMVGIPRTTVLEGKGW